MLCVARSLAPSLSSTPWNYIGVGISEVFLFSILRQRIRESADTDPADRGIPLHFIAGWSSELEHYDRLPAAFIFEMIGGGAFNF